ncbi:LamG domain-containing protein [Flavobacterium sp. GA093]|uniref:LamG domain-containing protein n=1 Tax=Flavobacterium hydrocarbonoxydans TaxID=2683249 RepID=A0A6I4NTM7_9FLAO|nr:LamG-like jellyroll fold domain-containing protein [Flavobacterium hydrocarbonoxydans]MWB95029.1 LamG domain-containing protein [Flavobacterium hydrocarbonoxydans]
MKKNKSIFLLSFVLAATIFVSCEDSIDKTNSPIPYESIGGYDSSDDVAAAHLVSKFSFDGNLTDSKSNISGFEEMNVAYANGVKGNAYQGSSSVARYAVGNATAKITSLNDYSISFWMNTANTVPDGGSPGQGKGAQGIFSIVRPTEFWGGINLFLENPDSANPNRLRLKLGVENGRAGVAWKSQSAIVNIDNSLNTWVHVVLAYDSKTSTINCYTNGAPSANIGGFPYAPTAGVVGSVIWYADDSGTFENSKNAPKYGAFEMIGTNGKVVFGNHQFQTNPSLTSGGSAQGWATSYAGLMDEFRIYDSALTTSEVTALYKLEKDKR